MEKSGNRNYQEKRQKRVRDGSIKKDGCMGGSGVETLKEEERMVCG